MTFQIDLLTLKDPNLIGEALRRIVFPGEGYGCYSTFEVAHGFTEIDPLAPEHEHLARVLSDRDTLDEARAFFADVGVVPVAYAGPQGLEVAWYWDGDGTLAFALDERIALVNGDCKKDHGWEFVPLCAGLARPRDCWITRTHPEMDAPLDHPVFGRANRAILGLEAAAGLEKFWNVRMKASDLLRDIALAATSDPSLRSVRSKLETLRADLAEIAGKYTRARELPRVRAALDHLESALAGSATV